MFLVRDAAMHAQFLKALRHGHGYQTHVDAWYDGERIAQLDFGRHLSTGQVAVTGLNRERRTLTLTAAESLWPRLPSAALSPYGVWLQAWVTVTAGKTSFPPVPVFAGKLGTVKKARWEGMLDVAAVDPMWQVNKESFESMRPAPRGMEVVSAIAMLLAEVFPGATLDDRTGSTATIPASTAWDAGAGSRGRAIDELAASIGAEVYADPYAVSPAGTFVVRPVPGLADTPAWTLPDGDESVVVGDVQLQSGLTVVNRWVITSERSDRTPIREVVTDSDPGSPTRYGGPMGKLVDFFSSPLITDNGQAIQAGRAKLNRTIGAARPRNVEVIANPTLDAGDILAIGVDGEQAEYHIIDSFTLPLTPDPASMSIATRSVGGHQ